MLESLTNEIKAQLYDRARSPLTGSFAISWVAWNFKPLVVLFSDETLSSKFNIWGTYYSSSTDSILFGFAYPLLSASLYILLYPYPARWAYRYWHTQHKELKKAQQLIEDETPLTQEEARALRVTSIQEMTKMQEELGASATTNRELTNRNKELLEQLAELQKSHSQMKFELDQISLDKEMNNIPQSETDDFPESSTYLPDHTVAIANESSSTQELNPIQLNILEQLSHFENQGQNWITEHDLLVRVVPRDITEGKIALFELLSGNFVSKSTMGKYSLSHEGRLALKKHRDKQLP